MKKFKRIFGTSILKFQIRFLVKMLQDLVITVMFDFFRQLSVNVIKDHAHTAFTDSMGMIFEFNVKWYFLLRLYLSKPISW